MQNALPGLELCKTAGKISFPSYQMSVWLQITNIHTEKSSRKSALSLFWFKLSLCLIHSSQTKHMLKGNRTFHRLWWMLLNKSNRRTQSRKRHICRCINVLNPQLVLIYGEPLQTFTGTNYSNLDWCFLNLWPKSVNFTQKSHSIYASRPSGKSLKLILHKSANFEISLLDSHIKRCHWSFCSLWLVQEMFCSLVLLDKKMTPFC